MPKFTIQIRPGDCDVFGHVNNAVYLSYFQHALAESLSPLGLIADWQSEGCCYWSPQSLSLEYRRAAVFGDSLDGSLWLVEPHSTQPVFGFEICSQRQGETSLAIFRAKGAWGRKNRKSGALQEIGFDLLAGIPEAEGALPHNFHLPEASSRPKQYSWEHTIELREIDATRHVHLQVLYQWLEDSLMDAIDQAGWPLSRWLAAGYYTLQTRHDSEIRELPGLGESVRITSRLVDMHRLGGTWLQEVRRAVDGQVLAKDYSTGVFLNLNGRPASPPSEIFEAIQFG